MAPSVDVDEDGGYFVEATARTRAASTRDIFPLLVGYSPSPPMHRGVCPPMASYRGVLTRTTTHMRFASFPPPAALSACDSSFSRVGERRRTSSPPSPAPTTPARLANSFAFCSSLSLSFSTEASVMTRSPGSSSASALCSQTFATASATFPGRPGMMTPSHCASAFASDFADAIAVSALRTSTSAPVMSPARAMYSTSFATATTLLPRRRSWSTTASPVGVSASRTMTAGGLGPSSSSSSSSNPSS
mmetsp:Transcript_9272/g.21003  ORF Transcript_9272/g.21003 Transcript_9272/m.21003 type:complete len:247 (-) Transcript_9272:129-869(-)